MPSAVKPADLLAVSEQLTQSDGKPTQASLRRAVSSAYYALFHALASECADRLIGGPGARRSTPAWRQTYRALEHGFAKNACKNTDTMKRFPQGVRTFAREFVTMQEARHAADYDPVATFQKTQVAQIVDNCEAAIALFRQAPVADRRAFCAHVLFKSRGA